MLMFAVTVLALAPETNAAVDPFRTVAEQSGFRATARYDEVITLGKRLAASSTLLHLSSLGSTVEGRPIPLWVVADPPVSTPERAAQSGKLVVLLVGNIHGGEVCGKEALPMLVRDLIASPGHPLFKNLIIAVVPILNADGNERVARDNRPDQAGPEAGTGQRGNARGLDLNRDFMKLEAPETRALVRFLRQWNPALVVDTHATNGSFHRYTITYDGPKNPAGDQRLIAFTRGSMFPEIRRRFETVTGHHAFLYGNFANDHRDWTTFPALPRFGTTYVGLRNRLSLLSEAYAYAPFETRVQATRDFVRAALEFASEQHVAIGRLLSQAGEATTRAGQAPQAGDRIAIRSRAHPFSEPATILGYVEEMKAGKPVSTRVARDYQVALLHDFQPAETVLRPFAYLIPPVHSAAIEILQRHGLALQQLREDVELDVETYRVDALERSERPVEGHRLLELTVTPRTGPRRVPAGTIVVALAEPLGTLAVYLLEPRSDDGLFTWNVFDEAVAVGADVPVLRIPAPVPLLTAPLSPPLDERPERQPISFEAIQKGAVPRLGGDPTQVRWLDNTHLLQVKEGRSYTVEAKTGRAEPYRDNTALARALGRLPTFDEAAVARLLGRAAPAGNRARRFAPRGGGLIDDPAGTAALIDHEDDLYHATYDGTRAVRLTSRPGREEVPTFSPDGRFVAFVRDNDLWVVDVATQTERALTTGGTDNVRHGKAGWVYYEELLDRNWCAFWWSPDSTRIAFLQTDEAVVKRHPLVNPTTPERSTESTPYPRPGEPNPLVRLAVVAAAGGAPRWLDLSGYLEGAFLISHVGWHSEGGRVYAYIQDRAQTWLDLVIWPVTGEENSAPRRLFHETTRAWVESPGAPHFLDDGSFLWLSERDGYRHLYHYSAEGTLQRQVTKGPWEVRTVHRVDSRTGDVLFSGTKQSAIGSQLYRAQLKDGTVVRLTRGAGTHSTLVSPDGLTFVDRQSDRANPTRVTLHNDDGTLVRTLDTNPVAALDAFQIAPREPLRITLRDGFVLDAELIAPTELDPTRKYPVWVTTYGGPHAPTVADAWAGALAWEQALAHDGFLVFRVDPRTASNQGAVSTWSGYRRLGVQELRDLAEALEWLKSRYPVDAARIGIGGHSYGGFMAAFALTHSTLFAAGIAASPVTDWREYDSIYTERYMNTPQENPTGYEASSVVAAAKDLHGRLLIVHGAMDNNVSPRNTYRLVQALEQANKDFELMIYPGARHGLGGAHYERLRIDFIRRTLGSGNLATSPGGAAAAPPVE